MRTRLSYFFMLILPLLVGGCSAGGGSNASNGGSGGRSGGGGNSSACSAISLGQGANLNGFLPFPADNAWNQDISGAPVDPNSAAIINFIGSSIGLHPDFGSGLYNGSDIGIPYDVVGNLQSPVNITFTAYGDESDPGPMPVPQTLPSRAIPIPATGTAMCWC